MKVYITQQAMWIGIIELDIDKSQIREDGYLEYGKSINYCYRCNKNEWFYSLDEAKTAAQIELNRLIKKQIEDHKYHMEKLQSNKLPIIKF